jgi:predicted ATPase
MNTSIGQIIGNRYQLLQKLGEGGMGAVYRAFDRLNRHDVALKRVATGTDQLDPSTQADQSSSAVRIALAHEFQLLASLRHPHVISVIDYGFDAERIPYFTMSYLEGARNIVQAAQGKPQHEKLRLIVEMLQALAYVHRRGIIHHDLKPDNTLVIGEGQVKVLDFGLSTLSGYQPDNDTISGTLAYMPPEIIMGSPATPAADLYAVGMIACEIFGGKHPLAHESAGALISRILMQPIDISNFDIDYALQVVLTRLLAKKPDERYQEADEVIEAFCGALGQDVPQESIAIRESFLQAAGFVGRDAELQQLSHALGQAVDGIGSVWLIGGESGVGKSRLVDELRMRALVKGALVFSGQGVLEGEYAYELWRDPLRRLVIASDLTDAEAGILQAWLPDLPELIGREISEAPPLEGPAGKRRLLETIEAVFRRQQQPLLLVLEDLQWAHESFDLLRKLAEIAQEIPLLIVGTYRDDDAPELPKELPEAQVIRLGRLTDEGIQELSASILGSAGSNPQIVQFLKRETEGNVFFLVEIVRALAEQAGQLSLIGQSPLPKEIVAGGIQDVVRRRLDHVPESARTLLRVAAVAGRQIDLKLMQAVHGAGSLEDWLTECSNAAILEVIDEHWRFSHSKLREGLQLTMPDSERRELHRLVAGTLENIYRENADEYAALISEHYEQGGEIKQAAEGYVRAAKYAQRTYAPSAAVEFYQKALKLWQTTPEGATPRQEAEIYQGMGAGFNWQARFREASEAFHTARECAKALGDRVMEATALYGLADTQLSQHDLQSALESANEAERLAQEAGATLEHASALWIKGWTLFELGEMDKALDLGEKLLLLSEEAHRPQLMADSLNLVGVVNMMVGKYETSARQFERALRIYQELGNRISSMSIINNLGAIAFERGDYAEAAARYREALTGAQELRHSDAELSFMTNVGGALARGGSFAEAVQILLRVTEMSQANDMEEAANTHYYLAEAYLGQNKFDYALPAAQRALELAQGHQSSEDLVGSWRVLGQAAAGSKMLVYGPENKPYQAAECFAESIRIAEETGMEGERARTLRVWGMVAMMEGDTEHGRQMWQEARAIFEALGAIGEIERMDARDEKV